MEAISECLFMLLNEALRSQTSQAMILVPGATAVLRGGPGVGRGDSGQKTGPGFGWGPAKKLSSEAH